MRIQIDIDSKYDEPYVTIHVKEWTKEVEALVQLLKGSTKPKKIAAIYEDSSILLQPEEIDYVFAENRKVFAVAYSKKMELKMKLYEVETLLAGYDFIRFSKSVVGNMNQIDRFELSFNGNLCVYFKSGSKEYVTRKFVHQLKSRLLEGGDPNDSN